MLDGSTQHRMTFTFTIGIQKNPSQVFTISGPFPYRWPNYPESFSWSDSRLFRTLLGAKLSPWYPQCRSIDWIRNESSASSFLCSGFTFTDLVPIRQRSSRQLQSFYAVHPDPVRIFGGCFFFSKGAIKAISFLNDRISTRSESTWTTSVRQSYYGIRSNTSYKVNGRTATNPYCQNVQRFITPSTTVLSCDHRRTGWMPWQGLILRLLCETITVHKLPLRFLIGSRLESHIRASFDQKFLYTITHLVVLDE